MRSTAMAFEGIVTVEHETMCGADVVLCMENEYTAVLSYILNGGNDERVEAMARQMDILRDDQTLEEFREDDEFGHA